VVGFGEGVGFGVAAWVGVGVGVGFGVAVGATPIGFLKDENEEIAKAPWTVIAEG
jgi:hypothetical protein